MFMLRCVFWLSVMVASLPVGSELVRDWRGTRGVAAGALDVAATQAGTWCGARPGQCARDATRLTALVVAAARVPQPLPDGHGRPAVEIGAATRHRAAKTVLTDGR